MILLRIASLILVPALLMAPLPTLATAARNQPLTQRELYLVRVLIFQSTTKEAALARRYDAALGQKSGEIVGLLAKLRGQQKHLRAIGTSNTALQNENDQLEARISAMIEAFNDALAAKDQEFAKERELTATDAFDLMATTEGREAMEIFLSRDPGSVERANAVWDRLTDIRTARKQREVDVDNAAQKRRIARTNATKLGQGQVTVASMIDRWTQIPEHVRSHEDWLELSRLYQKANRLGDALISARHALEAGSSDRDRSIGLQEIGDLLVKRGDLPGALENYKEGVDIQLKLAAGSSSVDAWRDVFVGISKLGGLMVKRGDPLQASLGVYESSLRMAKIFLAKNPDSAQAKSDVAMSLINVGDLLLELNRLPAAQENFEQALAMFRTLAAADPDSAEAQDNIALALNHKGSLLFKNGDVIGELEVRKEQLGISRKLVALDPSSAVAQRDIFLGLIIVADLQLKLEDDSAAYESAKEGLLISRKLEAADPSSAVAQRDVAAGLLRMGNVLQARGDKLGALENYKEGLSIRRKRTSIDLSSGPDQRNLAAYLQVTGDLLVALDDLPAAHALYKEGLDIARKLVATNDRSAEAQRDLLVLLYKLASMPNSGKLWAEVKAQLDLMRVKNLILPKDNEMFAVIGKAAAEGGRSRAK